MGYQLDLATFKETFSVNNEGTRLKHSPGKRFKLFPYIANNNSEAITSLAMSFQHCRLRLMGTSHSIPAMFPMSELWKYLWMQNS